MLTLINGYADQAHPAFIVNVINDNGVWVAECDDLGLVTESDSYESLTARAWEVAPELFAINGYEGDVSNIRLAFVQEQDGDELLAL